MLHVCMFMISSACTALLSVSGCTVLYVRLQACSQIIGLAIEGDVLQFYVDVRVILTADPADGRAIE